MDKEELIDIMSELKLTQRKASEYLGVNERTVRRWVSGEAKMKGASKVALNLARQANRLIVLDWIGDDNRAITSFAIEIIL